MSFIYEQRLDPEAKRQFPPRFWKVIASSSQSLVELDKGRRTLLVPDAITACGGDRPLENFLQLSSAYFCGTDECAFSILHIFVAHLLLLPLLSIEERSRPYVALHHELDQHLQESFLPTIFLIYEATHRRASMDMDGRVFRDVLHFIISNPNLSLAEALGEAVATELEQLWSRHNLPCVKLTVLASQFPAPIDGDTSDSDTNTDANPLQLLPFSNAVFNEALADAHIDVSQGDEDLPAAEMDFSTIFQDAQHWHNHRRALLPKHLGGEDKVPPLTEWQRKRQLRSEQRFTAKLQWQAESLTGAWGKALQQITIVSGLSAKPPPSISQIKVRVQPLYRLLYQLTSIPAIQRREAQEGKEDSRLQGGANSPAKYCPQVEPPGRIERRVVARAARQVESTIHGRQDLCSGPITRECHSRRVRMVGR